MKNNITKIDGLSRFDNDGIEIFIDPSGNSFASIRGVARMAEKHRRTIERFIGGAQINVINVEIDTPSGKQGGALLSEDDIVLVLEKYNTKRLMQFAKLGVRAALHQLAGYEPAKEKPFVANHSKLTICCDADDNIEAIVPHKQLWELIQIAKLREIGEPIDPDFFIGIPASCLNIPLKMLEHIADQLVSDKVHLGYAEGELESINNRRKILQDKYK